MARHANYRFRQRIGARLREFREEDAGISQEVLANRVGVDRTYIGRLERGETGVTLETLSAILAAMSRSLADFFEPFTKPYLPRKLPRRRD